MANKANVRVSVEDLGGRYFKTEEDRTRVMRGMFKRLVDDLGILTEYKQRQCFESAGEKRRRKRKEAAIKKRKDSRQTKYMGD